MRPDPIFSGRGAEGSRMSDTPRLPVVVIPNVGQSVLANIKDGQTTRVWPPVVDSDRLIDRLKAPILKMMLFRRDAGFSDAVSDVVREVLEPLATRTDGCMRTPVTPVPFAASYEAADEGGKNRMGRVFAANILADAVGGENVRVFAYNFILPPEENAVLLDAFLDTVAAGAGTERVNLLCLGFGSAVLQAYVAAFGAKNRIANAVCVAPAFEGSPVVSALLEKRLNTSELPQLLTRFAGQKTAESAKGLIAMLPANVMESTARTALDTALDTALEHSAAFWAFVPPADYPAFAGARLSAGQVRYLREKTDRFRADAAQFQTKAAETEAAGARFFAVYGAGAPILLVFDVPACDSDGVVPCPDAGAACSPVPPERIWRMDGVRHDALAHDGDVMALAGRIFNGEISSNIDGMNSPGEEEKLI